MEVTLKKCCTLFVLSNTNIFPCSVDFWCSYFNLLDYTIGRAQVVQVVQIVITEKHMLPRGRESCIVSYCFLLSNIFFDLRYLEMFAAKDIQSRCRNLKKIKDVFKELKVLGRKKKSCTAQINKDILETIFRSTSTFFSHFFENCYLSPIFRRNSCFYLFFVFSHEIGRASCRERV